MKTVSIIPLLKLPRNLGVFDYQVPNDINIQPYQLVKIPWRSKTIDGLVLTTPQVAKKTTYTLKTVLSITSSEKLAVKTQAELIAILAKQYLTAPSLWWKQILPNIQKKKTNFKAWHQFSNLQPGTNNYIKPELSAGNFELIIDNSIVDLYQTILRKINITQTQLILCPDLETIKILLDKLPKNFQKKIAVFHKNLSKSEYTKNYFKVLHNEVNIIIGTRIAILLPFQKLHKILVCKADDYSFKSTDQNPRYWALEVLPLMHKLYGSQIFYLSLSPRVETYAFFKKNNYPVKNSQKKLGIKIIDLNQEINNQNYSTLSLSLEEAITTQLQVGNKSLLIINRKNFSKQLLCEDCNWSPLCPHCMRTVTIIDASTLFCQLCNQSFNTPVGCANCHGEKLKYKGITNQSFTHTLKKQFPHATISFLDSENTISHPHTQIYVATKYFLPFINSQFGLIAFIQADTELTNKDFRSFERAYSFMQNAFRGNTEATHLIQTYHPEHQLFMTLISNDYNNFWNYDMKWRRNLLYPPFVKYIKLIIKEHSQVQAEMNTKKIFTSLLKNIPKTIIVKDPFYTQTNKFYLGNIIISYTKQDPRPYLSKLSSEVIIDFDPEEI